VKMIKKQCKESKTIPVTGRRDLQGCDMSRLSHCLDNQLTVGDEVVRPTLRQRFTTQKDS
jgi:hypothetical protein